MQRSQYYPGILMEPTKCMGLYHDKRSPSRPQPLRLSLYNQNLPRGQTFSYLGVPFRPNGSIDPIQLIQNNTTKAISNMRVMNTIGLSPSGFNRLLSTRLYRQFIRSQMEYGVAITTFTASQIKLFETAQDHVFECCMGLIVLPPPQSMHHLSNLPSMTERIACPQAKIPSAGAPTARRYSSKGHTTEDYRSQCKPVEQIDQDPAMEPLARTKSEIAAAFRAQIRTFRLSDWLPSIIAHIQLC